MRRLRIVLLFAVLVLTAAPRVSLGCPMCQDAIPNSSDTEDIDQARLSRAYNNSIYLMVGMPYLLVGAVGFLVYRQVRLRADVPSPLEPSRTDSPGQPLLSPHPGDLSCSPSPDGAS